MGCKGSLSIVEDFLVEPITKGMKRSRRGYPAKQPMVTVNMYIPEKIKYAVDVVMYQEQRTLRREMFLVLLREALRARGAIDLNDNFIGRRETVDLPSAHLAAAYPEVHSAEPTAGQTG